jgi:hypothetical protein
MKKNVFCESNTARAPVLLFPRRECRSVCRRTSVRTSHHNFQTPRSDTPSTSHILWRPTQSKSALTGSLGSVQVSQCYDDLAFVGSMVRVDGLTTAKGVCLDVVAEKRKAREEEKGRVHACSHVNACACRCVRVCAPIKSSSHQVFVFLEKE